MPQFQINTLKGLDEFRDHSVDWNALWVRSFSAKPTVRAESIEQWTRLFSTPRNLTVVTVATKGRLIAGLPLIRDRLHGAYTIHSLPTNCWSDNGDLLLDSEMAFDDVLDALIDGLLAAGIRTLMLDDVPFQSEQWRCFQSALRRRRLPQFLTGQRPVGVVDTLGNWSAYEASWSSKFRSALNRNIRKLNKHGHVEVKNHRNPAASSIAELMGQAFVIEDKSWKGDEGSSILRTPNMAEYLTEEAKLMSSVGVLDLWFLLVDGKPLAFEYCHLSKGVCLCHKIGFDSEYRSLAPGKIIRYHQLQHYHEDPACDSLDTLGLFCPMKAKWATRTYQVGRLYASLGSPLSNALVRGFSLAKPWIRRLRGEVDPPILEPAAKLYLQSVGQTFDAVSIPPSTDHTARVPRQDSEILL